MKADAMRGSTDCASVFPCFRGEILFWRAEMR